MKYTKSACEKAQQVLENRREKDKSEYEKRLREIERNAPEIASMHRQIKNVNFELLKLVGSHEKNENTKQKIQEITEKSL